MKFLRKLTDRVKRWFSRDRLRMVSVEEIPEFLGSKKLYLVGKASPWLLVLKCPCGCKEKIQLNLLTDDSPSWYVYYQDKSVNVKPSIRRTKGCRSHFWIKKSQIKWCFD